MTTETQGQKSAVEFATTSRVHVAVNVADVERALPFYQVLFGQQPTKVRADYAKFEVAEPPLNFTLNQHPVTPGSGTLSHFGIQVKSTLEVAAAKERFEQSGLTTFDEDNVTCCYAVQDKVWVTDPDGNSWEVFVVLDADAPEHGGHRQSTEACACGVDTNKISSPLFGKTIELTTKSGAANCC